MHAQPIRALRRRAQCYGCHEFRSRKPKPLTASDMLGLSLGLTHSQESNTSHALRIGPPPPFGKAPAFPLGPPRLKLDTASQGTLSGDMTGGNCDDYGLERGKH